MRAIHGAVNAACPSGILFGAVLGRQIALAAIVGLEDPVVKLLGLDLLGIFRFCASLGAGRRPGEPLATRFVST